MTDTAIKARGETAFPEAGDGIVFRFRNSDLKRIEAEHGEDFFNKFAQSVAVGNTSFALIESYMTHGLKGPDGQPFTLSDEVLDDIPVHDLQEAIFDALCRSMRGQSAKEYLEEVTKALLGERDDLKDPLPESPETGLTSSDD